MDKKKFRIICLECGEDVVLELGDNGVLIPDKILISANSYEPEVVIKCSACGNELIEELW